MIKIDYNCKNMHLHGGVDSGSDILADTIVRVGQVNCLHVPTDSIFYCFEIILVVRVYH